MDFGAAKLDRRTLLTGAGAAALAPAAAQAAYAPSEGMANDVATALAQFRSSIPSNFEHDYVEYALAQSVVITRTMDFFGRTAGISAILPYAALDASSNAFSASNQGVSDVGFLLQTNIFGGPALTKQQFRSFVPETFASFHLAVTTPLGTYDATNPLNPSANRWMFNPTINYSYTPDQGWTWLEVYFSTRVFTTNADYRVGGASSLSQDPLFIVEGHASRNLSAALWVSADAYYNIGGETSIDGSASTMPPTRCGLGWAWA